MNYIFSNNLSFLYFRIFSFLLFFIPLNDGFGFLKSIPDSLVPKVGYLSFQAPPKLRFHEVDATADRRKLLRLNSTAIESPSISEPDKVIEDPAFPLISYEDNNVSSPAYIIPSSEEVPALIDDQLLPPNDPFVPQDLTEPNLNNTDELIEILETGTNPTSRANTKFINFVPPFTLDGGNLILESKSRYTRRQR